jgi:hypothetical protein
MVLRSSVLTACLLALIGVSRAQEGVGLKAGDDLPGSFQMLSVAGKHVGQFYCPVCDHGLAPGVLIFTREVPENGKPLATLLQKLDELIANRADGRLAAAAVFLDDGGYRQALAAKSEEAKVGELELTKAITARDEKAAQVAKLAKEAKLQNVTLGLGTDSGPKEYKIAKDAGTTVLIYNQLKVVRIASFGKDGLTAAKVDALLADVKQLADKVENRPAPAGKDAAGA